VAESVVTDPLAAAALRDGQSRAAFLSGSLPHARYHLEETVIIGQ
jgi:hypothetical protein